MAFLYFSGFVLGIETSCDETSVAVTSGHEVLSNVVASQVAMHQQWGGVVPEAASRAHVEALIPVLSEALESAGVRLCDIGAIAVTNRPGLVGALSVGVTAAAGLALELGIPWIGVHHLEGHLMSICNRAPEWINRTPVMALIASGGHTELVQIHGPMDYEWVAETLDDAAGEAFDKTARLMGLGYPGGRAIQEAAVGGNPKRYPLPIGVANDPTKFSFSGLKTAALRLVQEEGMKLNVSDAAASLQYAIVEALVRKTMQAADRENSRSGALVGGVAANILLRERLAGEFSKRNLPFFKPDFSLCTDNAAMIALAGSIRLAVGQRSDWLLDAEPNAPLPNLR